MTHVPNYLDQYWPITQDFGVIDAPINDVTAAYMSWWSLTGKPATRLDVPGGLGAALEALFPLNTRLDRRVLVPCAGNRTAFFQNGFDGSAPAMTMRSLARKLRVRAYRICRKSGQFTAPETVLEIYAPKQLGGDDTGFRRSLRAWKEEGVWHFAERGTPLRFEAAEQPEAGFDPDMLGRYLAHLGLDALSDAFFDGSTDTAAQLFQTNTTRADMPNYSMLDVLSGAPWAGSA